MKRALLHGFLGDPSVWDDVFGARGGIEHETDIGGPREADDIVLALPGHIGGDRVRPTWAENLDAIAERIRGCDLAIGYSLGGRVALGLLAMGAVPRVVLISVNPGIEEKPRTGVDEKSREGMEKSRAEMGERVQIEVASEANERAGRRASDAAWARRFRSEPLSDVLDAWEAQPLFATQSRVAAEILTARRARRLALDPEQIARSLEFMGLAEMPDYHAIVDDRCTLIVGADDSKYLAISRVLHARCHVLDHCGHDPLLEQPEALAKVLASIA